MSMAELIMTLVVAIIVFGPARLPMAARHLGLFIKTINRYKQHFSQWWQQQLNEAQLLENTKKAEEVDKQYHSN